VIEGRDPTLGVRELDCPLVRWDSHDGRTAAVSPTQLSPFAPRLGGFARPTISTTQYPARKGLARPYRSQVLASDPVDLEQLERQLRERSMPSVPLPVPNCSTS